MRLATLFFVLFLACPVLAHEAALPAIGEGYGVQVKEGRTSGDELDQIKEAGLSYVRFVIPWAEVEKGEGSYRWGYFDTFIARLRERGLKAVIVLGGGHPRFTKFVPAPKDNIDQVDRYLSAPSDARSVAGFARFAAATVEHYGGNDIVWELWNEPDQDRFWAPKADAQAYIALATAACRAIREKAPHAKIIGPGMADMPGRWHAEDPGFLGAVLQSAAGGCFDAVSVHPYRDGETPPETVLWAYDKLRAFVRRHTPTDREPLPVVATEWGFTLTQASEGEQAAYALRSFLLNSLAGVPLSIWYEWRDARPGAADPEAHFGLLDLKKRPKPAYRALREFLPPLLGARVEARVQTGDDVDFVLRVRLPDGRSSVLFWTADPVNQSVLILRGGTFGGGREFPLTPMPRRVDLEEGPVSMTIVRPGALP